MAKSALRDFIVGYERSDKQRGKKFFCRSLSGSVTPAMLHMSKRGIFKAISELSGRIQYMSTKSVGAAFLSFGIVTIILSFLADYGSATGEATTISFIIGVVLALLAIPLLLSDVVFAYVFQNVKILDKILFDFLCINRVPISESGRSMPISVMAVIGALLGFCGYFVPVWWVIFGVFIASFIYFAFGSPEFAFFSTFFVAPYISHMPYGEWILASLVLLSFVSFLKKVFSGKRVFSFEQYDALLMFIMVLTLISGAFSKAGGFALSLMMAVFMLGYFMASNLITNRRLADSIITAVLLSSIPPSVISFYNMVSAIISDTAGELVRYGVASVFPSTESFSVFLLVSIAFAMALIAQATGFTRVLFVFAMLLDIGALVMCSEPFAIFALVLGIVLYLIINLRRGRTDIATPIMIVLPYIAVTAIMLIDPSFLSLGDSVALWGRSLEAFVYNIVIGIGVNPESFALAVGGGECAPNIFVEMGLDIGIFALTAFILLLIIRTRHRMIYHEYAKHSEVAMISPVISVATLAIVAFGTTASVFADVYSYYIFWCVFGIGSAVLRVAKKEYDDRVLYFEDAIDSESSVVDVKIL